MLCVLLLWLQLPVGARLLQHQHGDHQLLHQSHNPLLRLQEVQKLLQGKNQTIAALRERVCASSCGSLLSPDVSVTSR